jgi:prepilin-type processing-associated H-X9-DG protein
MRQFYNLWTMYANDYHQYALPCYYQPPSGGTVSWWSWQLLGPEMGKSGQNNGGASGINGANMGNWNVEAGVLRCPAAEHGTAPSQSAYAANANWSGETAFFADYLYNYYMGVSKLDPAGTGVFAASKNPQLAQIPGNVILLVESITPNFDANVTGKHSTSAGSEVGCPKGFKPYFQNYNVLVNNAVNEVGAANRIGTPHTGGKMCNILSADGHVSTINPFLQALVPLSMDSGNTYTYVGGPNPYTYAKGDFMNCYVGPPSDTTRLPSRNSPTGAILVPPSTPPYNQGWTKGLPDLQ